MKLVIFLPIFMLLIAPAILAAGLQITEIDVHVDYDEAYTYRVENRDRIDSTTVPVVNNSKIGADILPGSNVTFTIRAENTFQGEGPDLKGVFVGINIEDIDDGADLEEESIDFDLEPGGDYRFDVNFAIPIDVEAGTYNAVIEAEGEDKNETTYNTEVNLKLEVKKQSHDIRITRVLLNPSVMDCDRKAKLTAEIANVGSNLENEVALEFKATSIGVNSYDKDISLQSSDEAGDEEKMHTKTLSVEVPSFLRAGSYPILINLYWKNFVLFDQKSVDLVVRDCSSAGAVKKPEGEIKEEPKAAAAIPSEEEKPEEEIEEFSPEEIITATQEISIADSPILLSMLLGGFVIVILAVLVAVAYLKNIKPQ